LWHKADIEAGLLLCPLLGESGHQPAIAYGATTLSLDQPPPGTDKMKCSDVVSAERCHTVEFFGAPW